MGSSPAETEIPAEEVATCKSLEPDKRLSVCPTSQAGILSLFFSFTITTMDMRYAGDTCRVKLAFNTVTGDVDHSMLHYSNRKL